MRDLGIGSDGERDEVAKNAPAVAKRSPPVHLTGKFVTEPKWVYVLRAPEDR
jgi:hypothetical protein